MGIPVRNYPDKSVLNLPDKEGGSQKQYLNRQEIIRIMGKRLDIPRLASIRDIFIFSCFTGIATQTSVG